MLSPVGQNHEEEGPIQRVQQARRLLDYAYDQVTRNPTLAKRHIQQASALLAQALEALAESPPD